MSTDSQNMKNEAESLRKAGQFEQALPLYDKLWRDSGETPDKWIGWGYAHCLRKNGNSSEALKICQDVYRIDPEFDNNNSLYGWCVYDIGIKQPEETFDEDKFIKAANAIVQLTTQGQYSPYEKAVFAVVHNFEKYKSQQKAVPHAMIEEWLTKLDNELLSSESSRGTDGKSYPSPKEDWYTSKAKLLIGMSRYEECIDICTRALSEFDKLHYDYDVWFRQYRSESYLALEEAEKALVDLEYMMNRKPDAWIRHRYAMALHQLGHLEQAIPYACEAAIPHQRLGFRWEVYLDLGKLLAEANQSELAAKHIQLAMAIRQDEGWEKIPENLQSALHQFDLSTDDISDAKSLHRELQSFWKSMKPRPITTHRGEIIRVHENGKSGHIMGDNGVRYFFGMRNYKDNQEAMDGMRVEFNLQENTNNRTGDKEMHAADIFTEQ